MNIMTHGVFYSKQILSSSIPKQADGTPLPSTLHASQLFARVAHVFLLCSILLQQHLYRLVTDFQRLFQSRDCPLASPTVDGW